MTEKKNDLPRTYAIWAEAKPDSPMAGLSGFLSENSRRLRFSDRDAAEPNKVVYIASPLSGDIEQNLQFARLACRYAMAQGAAPFAPHLLYTQMLDDSRPEERKLGIDMGSRMLERCDELWLCGDRISHGMAGEKKLAEALGIPVRSIGAEEILSVELSPTKGMGMSMG